VAPVGWESRYTYRSSRHLGVAPACARAWRKYHARAHQRLNGRSNEQREHQRGRLCEHAADKEWREVPLLYPQSALAMGFGQLVIGAPGCGKTTYCHGMSQVPPGLIPAVWQAATRVPARAPAAARRAPPARTSLLLHAPPLRADRARRHRAYRGRRQFLNAAGRETVVVNLDPGNDLLPYDCAVDVMELIRLEDAMEEFDLGPNGGLVYCMEYIEQNLDWLQEQIKTKCSGKYILFDLPGQVELYTHHASVRAISEALVEWGIQVCAVHLVDGHHCSDSSKFLSTALVALAAMTMLELPHVNILSKIDLIRALGKLDFNLDYYLRSAELEQLPRLMRIREGLGADSDASGEEHVTSADEGEEEEEQEAAERGATADSAHAADPEHSCSATSPRSTGGRGQIRAAQVTRCSDAECFRSRMRAFRAASKE